jgi:hypothetical protein
VSASNSLDLPMRLHLVHLERSFKIIIEAHAIVMVRRIECGRPYARTSALFCESFGSGTSRIPTP